ncbi:hypothetical protein QYE76_023222 [Lolium multiflorum]|uniref:Uncharacterized protein n=1 Tax=Lolium multiflorum TaxID=4521 RepID=A0AAD8VUI8_LOLMU|nr:hypothetical protein QYE76_023222 [Lolium multiflorum]
METSSKRQQQQQQPVLKYRGGAAAATTAPPHPIHSPPMATAAPGTSGSPSAPTMADSQSQVEGLRKAYAEIMLNMAKESAARVLEAERRAAALAGAVAAAKEEGVATLCRLKGIMKAKIKLAESQSLAHVRTINELQEQLHGAQNTVASLQVELQRANTELEETQKTLAEERMNILPTCDKVDSNKSKISRSKRHLQNRMSSKNNNDLDAICSVPTDAKENMSSFRARNKKSELYRNGCTQRIRALKQRSPSADSSETNRKQASASNNRSKTGKNDNAKNTGQTRSIMEQILQTKFLANCKGKRGQRSRPSYMHDSSDVHVKTEDKPSDTPKQNGCLLLIQALEQELSTRQLFTGHSGEGLTNFKDDLLMGGKDAESNISMASPGPIDVHAVSNLQIIRRKRSKTVRVFETGCSESKSAPGNNLVRSTSEDTTFKCEQSSGRIEDHSDTPAINNIFLLCDAAENLMRSSDAADKLMHQSDATENLINPSGSNTDQFLPVDSSLLALQSTKSQVDGEGALRADHPYCGTSEFNLGNQEEVKADESCNLASDRVGPVITSSLEKEHSVKPSSGVSVQAEGGRCIKYTFNRRKRKNVSVDSTSQGAVPEKSSSLVSLADKQESQTKPEIQNLLVESPRGNNRRKRKNVSVDSTSQGAVPEKSSSLVSLAGKRESRTKPETKNLLVESARGNNHLVNIAQQLIILSGLKRQKS